MLSRWYVSSKVDMVSIEECDIFEDDFRLNCFAFDMMVPTMAPLGKILIGICFKFGYDGANSGIIGIIFTTVEFYKVLA